MNTLFPLTPVWPAGFRYIPDFISEADEKILIESVVKITLHPMKFQGYVAKRQVASFGYDWSFDRRSLSKGKEIPADFDWLVNKVSRHLGIAEESIAELLLTEYAVGSVINWHRDDHLLTS